MKKWNNLTIPCEKRLIFTVTKLSVSFAIMAFPFHSYLWFVCFHRFAQANGRTFGGDKDHFFGIQQTIGWCSLENWLLLFIYFLVVIFCYYFIPNQARFNPFIWLTVLLYNSAWCYCSNLSSRLGNVSKLSGHTRKWYLGFLFGVVFLLLISRLESTLKWYILGERCIGVCIQLLYFFYVRHFATCLLFTVYIHYQ